MIIKNIIFHQVIKEANGNPELNLSQDVIVIDDDVKDFATKLIKSFNSKYPTQGTFEENADLYPFQKYINEYLEEEDFVIFSHQSMEILEDKISIHNATGGYVVFLHYIFREHDFLITIMLDKSDQFTVHDDSLGIEKLKTLDLDKIARGSRLNITRWINENSLYLSFIKGTRTLSNYFINFIGATDITSSKENIKKLYNSVNNYLHSTTYTRNKKEKIKERITDYFTDCYQNDRLVELNSISAIISADSPNLFLDYLEETEDDISDNIKIVKSDDFSVFKSSKVKGDGFELHYDRKLLKSNKLIAQNGKIVISGVSEDIIKQINNGL